MPRGRPPVVCVRVTNTQGESTQNPRCGRRPRSSSGGPARGSVRTQRGDRGARVPSQKGTNPPVVYVGLCHRISWHNNRRSPQCACYRRGVPMQTGVKRATRHEDWSVSCNRHRAAARNASSPRTALGGALEQLPCYLRTLRVEARAIPYGHTTASVAALAPRILSNDITSRVKGFSQLQRMSQWHGRVSEQRKRAAPVALVSSSASGRTDCMGHVTRRLGCPSGAPPVQAAQPS